MSHSLSVLTSSKTDCWNTPPEVVDEVLKFFDGVIHLDPCSNSHTHPNIPALNRFTEDDNGLAHQWNYPTVFMNHPYSDSKHWIPYAVNQHLLYSNETLLLIKMDVSTKWWSFLVDYPFLAYNRRLKFGAGKGAAPFQSAMVYLGNRITRFAEVFAHNGTIYQRVNG
jgi:phage N-6-adenine-methyltransferase